MSERVVVFDRVGPSGNIFYIMGMASRSLRLDGLESDAEEMVSRVRSSGSYEEALRIISEYVDLVEV